MKKHHLTLFVAVCAVIVLTGCARAAKDQTGFAIQDQTTVAAPLDQTWQAAKAVLREMELDIFTRDKRGVFVAYTPMKRTFFITPHRTEFTITMTEETSASTHIAIETVNQVYGTTLLTYPNWHDRKAKDNSKALAILDGIKAKITTS